jgi:uncharacterized membrane protein
MTMTKRIFCWLLAAVMIMAGVAHFTITDTYVAIMPPYIPLHREMVHLSGALEILGGLGLLVPQTRRFAAWGIFALLIAVLPANIHQAVHGLQPPGLEMSPTIAWVRVPLQLLPLAWAYWMTRPDRA